MCVCVFEGGGGGGEWGVGGYFLSCVIAMQLLFVSVSVKCELLSVFYHSYGVAFCICHV